VRTGTRVTSEFASFSFRSALKDIRSCYIFSFFRTVLKKEKKGRKLKEKKKDRTRRRLTTEAESCKTRESRIISGRPTKTTAELFDISRKFLRPV
jgi:hypothetical protein